MWRRPIVITAFMAATLSGCAHLPVDEVWPTTVSETPGGFETRVHAVRADRVANWSTTTDLLKGPRAVATSDGPYLLDTGDRLRVFVYGQPDLSRLYTVDHTGKIVVPLIGRVTARGRTIYSVARAIRTRLARRFVRDPQVTVDVHQNRPFFILGEVRSPGQYPYVNGMTVKTAVAIAGGYSERAKVTIARITRRINGVVEVLDVPSDYVLTPGDTIEVPERFF